MRNIIIMALLVCFSLSKSIAHGNHTASFNFTIYPSSIHLEFKIEKNLLDHFELDQECEGYKEQSALFVFKYLNSNSKFDIDGEELDFEIVTSYTKDHYYVIEMSAEGDFSNVHELFVINNCFLEFDEDFGNRIVINKGESKKSYLLDFENTELTIKLD